MNERRLLFSEESPLPAALLRVSELRPAANLSAVFEERHDCIYADEGALKDEIFHETVESLIMKLYDEQNDAKCGLQFGDASGERRSILANRPSDFEPRIGRLFDTV